jgi:hypothetical protein
LMWHSDLRAELR